MTDAKISSVRFIDGADRKVIATLTNGAQITIVPCVESFEQFGALKDELYRTVELADGITGFLHGDEPESMSWQEYATLCQCFEEDCECSEKEDEMIEQARFDFIDHMAHFTDWHA